MAVGRPVVKTEKVIQRLKPAVWFTNLAWRSGDFQGNPRCGVVIHGDGQVCEGAQVLTGLLGGRHCPEPHETDLHGGAAKQAKAGTQSMMKQRGFGS